MRAGERQNVCEAERERLMDVSWLGSAWFISYLITAVAAGIRFAIVLSA